MPLYDYLCKQHGCFEANQHINKRQFCECPKCNKPALRQFNLAPAVHYKGVGWASIDGGKRFESQLTERGKKLHREKQARGLV